MSALCVKREGTMLYYEGEPGDHISRNIKEVIQDLQEKYSAQLLKFVMIKGSAEPTEFTGVLTFNETEISMVRTSHFETVEAEWQNKRELKSAAWHASPEGVAYAAEQEAKRLSRQEDMHALWAKLQAVLVAFAKSDEAMQGNQPTGDIAVELFDLLAPYISLSDWSNMETYRAECVGLLKTCNYKSGEYIGPADLIDTGDKQRAFIAGRMIQDFELVGCFQPILEHMLLKAQLNTHNPIPYKPESRPPVGKSPFDKEQ